MRSRPTTRVLDHLDPAALSGAALRSGAARCVPSVTDPRPCALARDRGPGHAGLRELGTWRTTGAATTAPTPAYDGPDRALDRAVASLQPHARM